MAEGLRARQDYLPSGERKRVLFREEDRRTTLRCKQTRQADGRGDGGMKRYEAGGKEVVKVRNKEKMSKWIPGCPGGFGWRVGEVVVVVVREVHLMNR